MYKKAWFALTLIVVLVASGCGGGGGGAAAAPIKIGGIFDLTGGTADVGVPY